MKIVQPELKILMLEDSEEDADMLIHELTRSGIKFISKIVDTRETYVDAIDSFKPDLILSDYSLPSFDGVSAFHIRQEKSPDIPFIIVSGTIGEEVAVDLIKSGVTDYLLKDKLFSIHQKITRALKEVEEKKEKKSVDQKLRTQNKKLYEIAILQSHQVRSPIASLLGLINLIDFKNPKSPLNLEVLSKLGIVSRELDDVIHEIVRKTNEIRAEV
jgi:DNA-binding NtrC family response regulator